MGSELRKAVWSGVLALALIGSMWWPAGAEESAPSRKVIRRVTPVYSELARKSRLVGVVKLSVTVAEDGSVKAVRTIGGNAVLVTSAEQAAKQWKYEPSKKETIEAIAFSFNGELNP
jgi:TonB family protein